MARGKRTKIDTGIYQDAIGFSVCAKIHGTQFEKRCKAQPDQALRQRWIAELTEKMPTSTKGTLAGDIAEYLTTLPPKSTRRKNAEWQLEPWKELLGEEKLKDITSIAISQIIARWREDGYAASTINHRRQELSNVFTTHHGKSGVNPVRDTKRIPEVYDEPRGFPQLIVRLILKQIPDGPHKRRLRVIATTGLPPAQIVRLQRHDFNERAATVFVRPRRKGAGVKGRTLPLTVRAVSALRDYFALELTGWSQVRTREYFRAGVEAAQIVWSECRPDEPWPAPPDLVVYDLRHAFLTYAYKATRDLNAVAELGLHSDLKTTRRYAEAAVSDTARAAIGMLDKPTRK